MKTLFSLICVLVLMLGVLVVPEFAYHNGPRSRTANQETVTGRPGVRATETSKTVGNKTPQLIGFEKRLKALEKEVKSLDARVIMLNKALND